MGVRNQLLGRRVGGVACVLAVALVAAPPASARTLRVSVAADGSQGNGQSSDAAVSANGRLVAFASTSSNLVAGDSGAFGTDIFVRDRDADRDGVLDEPGAGSTTVRVSVSTNGAEADGPSLFPQISADGRFVGFRSAARNLVPDDTFACTSGTTAVNCTDIFVRDRDTDRDGVFDEPGGVATVRVSVATDGTEANGNSGRLAMSSDGRFVVFESNASNLVPGDLAPGSGGARDVFVRDRDTDGDGVFDEPGAVATRAVSAPTGLFTPANVTPLDGGVDISADGRVVVFEGDTPLTGETPTRNNGRGDVLLRLRDLNGNGVPEEGAFDVATLWLSGAGSDFNSDTFIDDGGFTPAISDSGRQVIFNSPGSELVAGDTNGQGDVFLVNLATGVLERASVSTAGGQGDQGAFGFADVNNGLVAFASPSANLVEGDTNECAPFSGVGSCPDVFTRRPREPVATRRASVADPALGNAQANAASVTPSIASTGCAIAFESDATNLIAGDTNGARDVFIRTLDADGDALCDDWEANGIDIDGDTHMDYPLHLQADPNHRDIFVELDWMAGAHSHDLSANARAAVVTAFRNAPVANPDGRAGIDLHITRDEELAEVATLRFTTRGPGASDDFDDLKSGAPADPCDGAFGTPGARAAVISPGYPAAGTSNCRNTLAAMRLVQRYVISGHNSVEGGSGVAEVAGNDVLVTLRQPQYDDAARAAAVKWGTTFEQERSSQHAGTLMHELGHTLGLRHGGANNTNCKPNYLSVMRYGHQFNEAGLATGLAGIANGTEVRTNRPLDYSRAALDTLDEAHLNENSGIGGPAGQRTLFGRLGARRVGPSSGAINWNLTGGLQADIASDVNWLSDKADCGARARQQLDGHDDWANLGYDFRASTEFADGDRPSALTVAREPTDRDYLAGVTGPAKVLIRTRNTGMRRSRVVPIRLTCRNLRCRGRLSITRTIRTRSRSGRPTRPRTVMLGSAPFTLAPRRSTTVNVRLTQAGALALVRAGRLRATATATYGNGLGARTLSSGALTIRFGR